MRSNRICELKYVVFSWRIRQGYRQNALPRGKNVTRGGKPQEKETLARLAHQHTRTPSHLPRTVKKTDLLFNLQLRKGNCEMILFWYFLFSLVCGCLSRRHVPQPWNPSRKKYSWEQSGSNPPSCKTRDHIRAPNYVARWCDRNASSLPTFNTKIVTSL
jgi:hypothetical protein